MGIKFYHLVEVIDASEDVIETPAEEIALWQRMSIFDARSMLGLYCYRAGYYPAALAQWSRIPERNRVLRPEITRLLIEVDNRLALEKQETQPMRRDQILQQQEPILEGNLPLADLPNPYEPVRKDETGEDPANWPEEALVAQNDDDDDEERHETTPLRADASAISATNGHTTPVHEHSPSLIALRSSIQTPLTPSPMRTNWLARLRKHPSQK